MEKEGRRGGGRERMKEGEEEREVPDFCEEGGKEKDT